MHVASLALTDFRNYQQAELTLAPGVTTFVGANGQGKTNLVEAVGYLSGFDSHRVATDAPLVRHGAQRAVIRAGLVRDARRTSIEIEINPSRANRVQLGGHPVRPRELAGTVRTVLFAPEDLALVKGDPSDRRRFLDTLLVARAPKYAGVKADFERVVRQRNALLKSAGGRRGRPDAGGTSDPLQTLMVWDEQLIDLGSALLAGRIHLLDQLNPLLGKTYDAVADASAEVSAGYRWSLGEDVDLTVDRTVLAGALRAALERRRREELERAVTLVGPHRDDVLLSLAGVPAKGYASHGESWSLALALRLASYQLLRDDGTSGGEPILVLDDVFAELDVERRSRLAALVGDAEQVLVTAAVAADVPATLTGARVRVERGTIVDA